MRTYIEENIVREINLIPLDYACMNEHLEIPQAEKLIEQGLFPSPIPVRISRRQPRKPYIPAHELTMRNALLLSETDESRIVERLFFYRANRVAIVTEIQKEIQSLIEGSES